MMTLRKNDIENYYSISATDRLSLAQQISSVAGCIAPCDVMEDGAKIGVVLFTHPASRLDESHLHIQYIDNRDGQHYLWLAEKGQAYCICRSCRQAYREGVR